MFMDIKGGIPRGADFERVLTDALAGCEVLLALIGPQWLACTRTDGIRRLDVPEDWVRNEIASALQRNIGSDYCECCKRRMLQWNSALQPHYRLVERPERKHP